ncbi:efflux RND transporter periplasmic adaptor subunit [Tenuifilum thalassicum]|uniref:Efflux RND transporter periplasmic adaptor subunit n=1 Tax=Tenuifilum thalassicum TaxID=2590900 RepID=A0A7D4BJ67_9BACT|nr:efflux RND transporter periplasmic adaptor subunit [Tenuifilum thalassicum]QKG79319.1 efflux RND transporter periplasmic adaptor subunit [Tenuifilum thalassicum]
MKMIRNKRFIYSMLGIALLVVAFFVWRFRVTEPEFSLSTAKVERGTITNTITATGTLEATNTVVVGTQVSGVIEKIYVDFNSRVKKGQLIAELDKSTLLSSLENAEADLERAEANFEYQTAQLARNKILYEKGMLAKSDYDLILYNYKVSKAEVKSAKANLERAQRNVSYASIYSPIDGVVLNRAVEEGQTVAAAMNTPELFTITNDLSVMQVEANIDEADIGQLKVGQRVEFTVDAFPETTFNGNVSEIRLQPNENSNVVTYTAIITVNNPDLKLKPGMTASITVFIEEAHDVLTVKEKATRFTPDPQLLHLYLQHVAKIKPEKQQDAPKPPRNEENVLDSAHRLVWVVDNEDIYPVEVETGISDGTYIEITSGLQEGDLVLTSLELLDDRSFSLPENSGDDMKSPFIQERPKRNGAGGPPPH